MSRANLVPFLIVLQVVCCMLQVAEAATFNIINGCQFTVWVGVQPNAKLPVLANGGFACASGDKVAVTAPQGWGGRFWGRTDCKFDAAGKGLCVTGDCGNVLHCNGAGGNPPASLAEITLNGSGGLDFYDISLVDGYNLPISMKPIGGTGECGATGCISDLNTKCPEALKFWSGFKVAGCKSACAAFNEPQYCCTGAYNTAATCPPTQYSKAFKAACPTAYSYAYDDATSTFTCKALVYDITFCPPGTA
ncbi:pathogenesis-related thaumatin-like protein 3.5 [Physcomitrium patens]|uniref:Thaumatin-like protein n=1 Tax=Physcomitrium patens TaxID=3218 RepID=A9SSI6_PHYPA|nr:pathogenesis-related protein 5-like [Physcomitrium patens]PNR52449.1 hypothetical protein PHYPA_008823 [Physcomitrium patens]|eukprot:XP_024379415.1 pathogenesis-related protein 5-like [Physcomitrella patens]